MRISRDRMWMAASCILLGAFLLYGVDPVMSAGEQDWLDAMVQAVLAEQAKEEKPEIGLRPMSRNWRPCARICSMVKATLCIGR